MVFNGLTNALDTAPGTFASASFTDRPRAFHRGEKYRTTTQSYALIIPRVVWIARDLHIVLNYAISDNALRTRWHD